MMASVPVVEWPPKLGAAEESRRRYTIYGKAGLESGEEWHSPTNALDRFFTVGASRAVGSAWARGQSTKSSLLLEAALTVFECFFVLGIT